MKDPRERRKTEIRWEDTKRWGEEETGGGGGGPVREEKTSRSDAGLREHKRSFDMPASDIIAIGIVILAIGAVLVAIIFSIGIVLGKVPVKEGGEIVGGCVGGSAISGIVAALLGRKGQSKRQKS